LHDEKERKTWMFVNPVGLGARDPLFHRGRPPARASLVEARTFDDAVVLFL
jgi:hypothetical protein